MLILSFIQSNPAASKNSRVPQPVDADKAWGGQPPVKGSPHRLPGCLTVMLSGKTIAHGPGHLRGINTVMTLSTAVHFCWSGSGSCRCKMCEIDICQSRILSIVNASVSTISTTISTEYAIETLAKNHGSVLQKARPGELSSSLYGLDCATSHMSCSLPWLDVGILFLTK